MDDLAQYLLDISPKERQRYYDTLLHGRRRDTTEFAEDEGEDSDLFEQEFSHVRYKCNLFMRKSDIESGNLKFNLRFVNSRGINEGETACRMET